MFMLKNWVLCYALNCTVLQTIKLVLCRLLFRTMLGLRKRKEWLILIVRRSLSRLGILKYLDKFYLKFYNVTEYEMSLKGIFRAL